MVDNSEMIFGVRAVIEAIQAGKEIDKILVKKDIQSDLSKELFAVLKGTLIPVQRVPVERINRVTRKNHQGVIAFISSVTYQKTEDLVPFLFEQGKNPLFVMLDGITDVRNFGAIARTCECAAVDAVIIPARNSVSVNADAMKTSAGALHTLPVCREHSLKETLQFLKNSGFHIVAATEKGDYDEAIQAGKEIDKILVKKDIQSDLSKELFAVLKGTLIPVQRVPVERINRVTRKNHQGVIAFISSVTYQKTEDLVPFLFEQGKNPLFVMLDGITDVRNFGAIARTCECAAVDAVIIPARNSVSVNADAMKTSAGALHTLPVCREHSLKETLQFLKNSGFHIVAATEKGDYDYTKADYTGPMCIIMGAEDKGVSYDNLALCDEWVKIPMLGTIESLNVSVAAGILIYEAVKQRTN